MVAEIKALGGEAVANGADVADFEQAAAMVQQAIDTFGGLDILVNNAGFVRDRMLVNTSEEEWDAVIRVHLKGHFAPLRHARRLLAHRVEGRPSARRPRHQHVLRRGDAGLDRPDDVLRRQGRHRRDDAGGRRRARPLRRHRQRHRPGGQDPDDRGRVPDTGPAMRASPRTTHPSWPGWPRWTRDVTGRVLEIEGGQICVEQGWRHGPKRDVGRRWEAERSGAALRDLIAEAADPEPVYGVG